MQVFGFLLLLFSFGVLSFGVVGGSFLKATP